MKKVLALVLAVIMVCTMAMAVTIVDGSTVTVISSAGFNGGSIPLNTAVPDANGYYYVQLGDNIFSYLYEAVNGSNTYTADVAKKNSKNFKVTLNASGAEFVFDTDGHGYIRFKEVDKPLDKKADISLTSLEVRLVAAGAGTSYFTVAAKDGELVVTKYVVKGNTWFDGTDVTSKAPAGVTAATFEVNQKAAYDVGYTPNELTTDGGCEWGWNVGKKAVTITLTNSNVDASDTTVIGSVKVAKDEYLNVTKQLKVADSITAADKAIAKVKDAHAIGYYGGLSVSKDASWTIDQGDNVYLYTVNADGTFSASAFKFVDGKGWTLTAKEMPLTVVTNVKMATVAGTTTGTGTTTNPGTGANDVVGVAAALAVVALVSGAAISLKK